MKSAIAVCLLTATTLLTSGARGEDEANDEPATKPKAERARGVAIAVDGRLARMRASDMTPDAGLGGGASIMGEWGLARAGLEGATLGAPGTRSFSALALVGIGKRVGPAGIDFLVGGDYEATEVRPTSERVSVMRPVHVSGAIVGARLGTTVGAGRPEDGFAFRLAAFANWMPLPVQIEVSQAPSSSRGGGGGCAANPAACAILIGLLSHVGAAGAPSTAERYSRTATLFPVEFGVSIGGAFELRRPLR